MSKTSQQQRRSKEKNVSEWGEQDGQALRVLDTHGLLGEKCHHSGLPKVKGRGGRFWGLASIPPGDHSGAKAKGNMTGESTCHPWHPLLPGCPSLFPRVPRLPARRTQFKARQIFLVSFSSYVNKKQISLLSCDHKLGSYHFFSGARLGWWEQSTGELCPMTPSYDWQRASSHLPSPNLAPTTMLTAWKTGSNHHDHLKSVSQTLHMLSGFSPGSNKYWLFCFEFTPNFNELQTPSFFLSPSLLSTQMYSVPTLFSFSFLLSISFLVWGKLI